MYKKGIILLCAISILHSCQRDKKDLTDIVEVNQEGMQVNKADTISIEEVIRLQQASATPILSYSSILTPSMTKTYPFEADSGQKVSCELSEGQEMASISLYREGIKTIRRDSATTQKIKDMILISEGSVVQDVPKKKSKYKAVVRLLKGNSEDSTASYTIKIFTK